MASNDSFRALVRSEGERLYRDLPWRRTHDPYEIWISEVMLQQTQVVRVEGRWPEWLDRFPSVHALAEAPTAEVLAAWQGMGYNRRALALKSAAQVVVDRYDGVFPADTKQLVDLPGIGPATAQGIRSFAFDLPGVYLETNVRSVFLHHFYPDIPEVPDRELTGLVEENCPGAGALPLDAEDTPRAWYYALLDYGANLKKTIPNPSRRSKGYSKQSRFEGSRRQKRAEVVRILLDARERGLSGVAPSEVSSLLDAVEAASGREPVPPQTVRSILLDLRKDGFCLEDEAGLWRIA